MGTPPAVGSEPAVLAAAGVGPVGLGPPGSVLAAAGGETALLFIEVGAVILALAIGARLAGRIGITAIPLYLLAGLVIGEGGVVTLGVGEEFISVAADIGVLLLLLVLGLEYSSEELQSGLRTGMVPGAIDAVVSFLPGLGAGLVLGYGPVGAVLLGGITWISSSGVVSKVLVDLDRLGNRETPGVLTTLVIEDLAMAVYLPVAAALVLGEDPWTTAGSVAVALVAVAGILALALRYGHLLSAALASASDEGLLLSVFGLTLLVAGLAEQVQVSAAIGAFLVGLALSGHVRERTKERIEPLRDLFAATFFLFFSFQIDPGDLPAVLVPALALAVVGIAGKLIVGWYAGGAVGAAPRGRVRAGTALIARGEFSIVIAALATSLAVGPELGALAAAYVLATALIGPVVARFADSIPLPERLARAGGPRPAAREQPGSG